MGFLAIGLKLLGWGQTLMSWLWDAIKGIFSWAAKYPFQFLSAVFLLATVFCAYHWNTTKAELATANQTIATKQKFIDDQGARLNQYVTALDDQKKILQQTVDTNNKAVEALKKTADAALASAQKEAAKAVAAQKVYNALAAKYANANPSTGTPAERIQREEQTTDRFISDWRKQ